MGIEVRGWVQNLPKNQENMQKDATDMRNYVNSGEKSVNLDEFG